jgi:hypothetical protein
VAKLTVAEIPSNPFNDRSIAATHAEQVMPSSFKSICSLVLTICEVLI